MSNPITHLDLYRTKVMLRFLEEAIPLRAPSLRWSDRDVWFYAGQRAVLDLINSKLNEETPLAPPGKAQ